ncbi:unnamed protein product [Phytophthora fragariaefolia]|uniref:Unnamed protein product n=1 Tax=Phytophthora fragariaefolia TaxID=1490495 RepID=A0A9W7DBV2_9STRA|nr:unnamed protein product [Phytophthora fragariaefolia]
MDVREVNRKSLWRELKKAGWSARPPRGLEVDYQYVPPGGNATGADGTDYFLGTAGVIQHYLDSRQTEAEDADDGAEDASVDEEEAQGERSDHAGDGKEGPGEENYEQSDSEPDAAANDDGGGDDNSHEGDAASASDEETKAEAPSSHARAPRRRSSRVRPVSALPELVIEEEDEVADTPIEDAVADPNTLASGDNPEDFDALDSGDEPERDDFDKDQQFDSAFAFAGGDSDSDSGSVSDDDVGAPRYQEELFNEAFLRDIGGLSAIDSGAMNSDALRQMGRTGWNPAVTVDVDEVLDGPYVQPPPDGEYARSTGSSAQRALRRRHGQVLYLRVAGNPAAVDERLSGGNVHGEPVRCACCQSMLCSTLY